MYCIWQKTSSMEKYRERTKIRCAVDVFRCLNNTSPGNFENYFTRLNHSLHTRGNKSSIKLPKVRTESGRNRFLSKADLFLMNFHEKSEMKHRSFDLKISAKNILFNC